MENATGAPSTLTTSTDSRQNSSAKLRSACDLCHQAKVRCSGGLPCTKCTRDSVDCHYSAQSKVGKPRGSRNKKTLEKLKAIEQSTAVGHSPPIQNASELCQKETSSHVADQMTNHTTSPFYSQSMVLDSAFEMLDEGIFPDFSDSENLFRAGMSEHYARRNMPSSLQLAFDPMTDLCMTANVESLNNGSVTKSPRTNIPDDIDRIEVDEDDDDEDDQEEESDLDSNSFDILDFVSATRSLPIPASLPSGSTLSIPVGSFQPHSQSSQQLSPIAPHQNLCSNREISSGLCQCLQIQVNQLCELRQVEQHQTSIQLDTILHFTGRGYQLLEKTFQCPACLHDQQCLQIAAMVLHTFLKWIEALQIKPSQPSLLKPVVDIQVGSYSINHEEQSLLEVVLILRLLAKTRAIAQLFRERIQQLKNVTKANELVTDYLQRVATSYFKILKVSRRMLKDKHAIGNQ